ncbi:MAG: BON domain-containing protein [Opitutaceae bacterium]|jgi:osmotically-inducible protein OsmY
MSTPLPAPRIALLVAVLGVLAAGFTGGCAATPTSDSTGQFVDDTAITARVKTALLGDDAVKSLEIRVETVKGIVQLSGFVDNRDQKSAAGRDASGVPNVKTVVNDLIVR